MNKEDIIRTYKQVSDELCDGKEWCWAGVGKPLQRFAALVAEKATEETNTRANKSWAAMCKKMVAAEREACAVVAEKTICDTHIPTGIKIYGTRAAQAIRLKEKA